MNQLRFDIVPSLNGQRGQPWSVDFSASSWLDEFLYQFSQHHAAEILSRDNQIEELRHQLVVARRKKLPWWRRLRVS